MPNKSRQRRGTGRRSGEDRPPDTASGHRRATARVPALAARGDGAVPPTVRSGARCAILGIIPTTVSRSH